MSLEELDYISVVQIKRKPESLIHIILVPVQYVLLINKIKMKKNIKLGDLLNKEISEQKKKQNKKQQQQQSLGMGIKMKQTFK